MALITSPIRQIGAALLMLAVPALSFSAGHCKDSKFAWGEAVAWEAGAGPPGREHAVMLEDIKRNRIIVFGGTGYEPQLKPMTDAWAFDLATRTWTELRATGEVPEKGGSRRATALSDRGWVLLYGGYDESQQPQDELIRMHVRDDSLHFEILEQQNAPPARFLHAFIHQPAADVYFTFGGVGNGVILNDAWRLRLVDGVGVWSAVETGGPPSVRYGFPFFYDSNNQRLVIAGGADLNFPTANPDDVWALSLGETPTWTQLQYGDGEARMSGRRNPQFSYDGAGRLVVWGGTSDGRSASDDNGYLRFSGDRVSWHAITHSPVDLRASGMGVYSASTGAHWLGFGNAEAVYTDLTPLRRRQ